MSRRRRRRSDVPIWSYINYGSLFLMGLWLLLSIMYKKNPTDLIKSGFATIRGDSSSVYFGTEQYKQLIVEKDGIIFALNDRIDSLESASFNIATVSAGSPTLNLRSSPSLTSSIVFKIPDGAAVEIQYYDPEKLYLKGRQGQWCKVRYADLEGWVWGNFLVPRN